MWDDNIDPSLKSYEKNFQKMLINNMESTIKIFFRGMTIRRVKTYASASSDGDGLRGKHTSHLDFNLNDLERKGIVATRVRHDTKVK